MMHRVQEEHRHVGATRTEHVQDHHALRLKAARDARLADLRQGGLDDVEAVRFKRPQMIERHH